MSYPTISDDPATQAHYERCRRAGTSHTLAEMFASATGPCLQTDTAFLAAFGANGAQFEKTNDLVRDHYAAEAKRAGVSIKGKIYHSGVAEFPGDPRAWVDNLSDVKRICEKKGWQAEEGGSVKVKGREFEHKPVDGVADHILDREVNQICAALPKGKKVDRRELKEQVRAKRRRSKRGQS